MQSGCRAGACISDPPQSDGPRLDNLPCAIAFKCSKGRNHKRRDWDMVTQGQLPWGRGWGGTMAQGPMFSE